jgi:hypothetical protein
MISHLKHEGYVNRGLENQMGISGDSIILIPGPKLKNMENILIIMSFSLMENGKYFSE